ncbi:MAG: hypothetical protein ACOX3Y_02305 [Clostridia bacterium]
MGIDFTGGTILQIDLGQKLQHPGDKGDNRRSLTRRLPLPTPGRRRSEVQIKTKAGPVSESREYGDIRQIQRQVRPWIPEDLLSIRRKWALL